eukprot:1084480-Amphidinium_carterae.1
MSAARATASACSICTLQHTRYYEIRLVQVYKHSRVKLHFNNSDNFGEETWICDAIAFNIDD